MKKALRPHVIEELKAAGFDGFPIVVRDDGVEEEIELTDRVPQLNYQPIDPATGELTVWPEPAPGQSLPEGVSPGDPVFQKRFVQVERFDPVTKAAIEQVFTDHRADDWWKIDAPRRIREEVAKRIINRFDPETQAKSHRRATKLLNRGRGKPLTPEEEAELTEIDTGSDWIEATEAHGEALIDGLASMTDEEVRDKDWTLDPDWPVEPPRS